MDLQTMNGCAPGNDEIQNGSKDFVPDGAQPTSLSLVSTGGAKQSPDDTGKRKPNETTIDSSEKVTSSSHKRAKRTDHMDSIATVGKQAPPSPRRTHMDEQEQGPETPPKDHANKATTPSEVVISQFVDLIPLPDKVTPLPQLTNAERKELERYLDFSRDETWREDWMGNLCFGDKDIYNPDGKSRDRSKKALFHWATKGKVSRKLLNNLVRYVYNSKEIPTRAKNILASADPKSISSVQEAVRRVSYDPIVLQNDGWTTTKSKEPIGASGGPYRIGERVFWQGSEGVVIAYVHDHDIGDLWKAMWLEELDTFDLEVEELEDAKRRFERKMKQKEQQATKTSGPVAASKQDPSSERRSGRKSSADFDVEGIEHGIILAVSYGRGARPGVFWPARVMHFSELQTAGGPKRLTTKQKVDVVFLAPYWNTAATSGNNRNRIEPFTGSLERHGSSIFSSGSLFEIENIDASPESIQPYLYDPDRGLDMDELSTSFRFAGLPKAAFSRFVESHRLALALKTYSKNVMHSTAASEIEKTTASLFEAHPLAGQTAKFPEAVLHLPFQFILSQLPPVDDGDTQTSFNETSSEEPALQLGVILEAMKPPMCWGQGDNVTLHLNSGSPESVALSKPFASPSAAPLSFGNITENGSISVDRFLAGLKSLSDVFTKENESMSTLLIQNLSQLLSKVPAESDHMAALSADEKKAQLKALVKLWIVVKTHGEELIFSYNENGAPTCLLDWRRACERIYKHITIAFSSEGFGNGLSWVVSDSRCNLHLTSNECFERAVRLPAAMKAAKSVAAEKGDRLKIMDTVAKKYLEMAEKEVVRRAHSKTYLRRMKKKCQSVETEGEIVALTADSDNNGGEDTTGTRGSWTAAIAAVAASVQAVDMVMNGECVNVFCLTRPPGHHAGRELHAMKAVSNGFCLLNSAACAALYATAPVSEGGPGLRRVCVIDIDVHHGNGTQDILCSTYDPRFLYVSIHAGGPDVNGVDPSLEEADEFSHHLARTPQKGVFPGRCGDFSPHQGVLNIPLGARVTSHALGAALMTKVTPAVEKFSPELIIISTGFDAHKNDPLGLGGLSAEDFGTLTEVICKMAHKSCSGRVVSILEGGYGVPCCRLPTTLFDPEEAKRKTGDPSSSENQNSSQTQLNGQVNGCDEKEGTATVPSSSDFESTSGQSTTAVTELQNPPQGDSKPTVNDVDGTAPKDTTSKFPTEAAIEKSDPSLKPLEILDLGDDLPENMKDDMPYLLMKRLDKCHSEGFMDCVREHVATLAKCNFRS